MSIEARIQQMGITLPAAPKPAGAYVPVVVYGNTAYLSGQISRDAQGSLIQGKVGRDLALADGVRAARAAALNAVSLIQAEFGLDRVERILRVVGYVQADPDFIEISQVVNGASELLQQIWGEAGTHARSSVGVASLPLNAAVEVELTIQLKA